MDIPEVEYLIYGCFRILLSEFVSYFDKLKKNLSLLIKQIQKAESKVVFISGVHCT